MSAPMNHRLDELMFTCAIRYCLTRHSYVTSAAVNWVHDLWPTLSPTCRVVLRRDLASHIEVWGETHLNCSLSAIDMRGWIDLLAWVDQQLTEEERKVL